MTALVMIVDDDADIRGALADLFSDRGIESLQARNGREALELLAHAEQRPRVILLDLIMPEMDGYQILARRHTELLLRGIPIVAMSASPLNPKREELKLADHVFRKPRDIDQILELVQRFCA